MITSINGQPAEWPAHVRRLYAVKILNHLTGEEEISDCNYFTPRPAVDEWNRGSKEEGFVYTLQPGNRVCLLEWTAADSIEHPHHRKAARRG